MLSELNMIQLWSSVDNKNMLRVVHIQFERILIRTLIRIQDPFLMDQKDPGQCSNLASLYTKCMYWGGFWKACFCTTPYNLNNREGLSQ